MRWFTPSKTYRLLAEDHDSESDILTDFKSSDEDIRTQKGFSNINEQIVHWSLYAVSLCVLVCTVAIGYILLCESGTLSIALKSDLGKLEWRSTYIDFDVLYGARAAGPRPKLESFVQHAATMAPVSKMHPAKVYTPPTRYAMLSQGGMAAMQSWRLLTTDEMSTVAQFRTVDWGMENCTLHVVLPQETNKFTSMDRIHSSSTLSVWLLDSKLELDVKKLSYASKPARVASLGQLVVSPGTNVTTTSFTCPRNAFPTVEIECVGPECVVDVLHTGRSEEGLFLRQSQSVF